MCKKVFLWDLSIHCRNLSWLKGWNRNICPEDHCFQCVTIQDIWATLSVSLSTFWLLKRSVSLRRVFWVPTTYVLVEIRKILYKAALHFYLFIPPPWQWLGYFKCVTPVRPYVHHTNNIHSLSWIVLIRILWNLVTLLSPDEVGGI